MAEVIFCSNCESKYPVDKSGNCSNCGGVKTEEGAAVEVSTDEESTFEGISAEEETDSESKE